MEIVQSSAVGLWREEMGRREGERFFARTEMGIGSWAVALLMASARAKAQC